MADLKIIDLSNLSTVERCHYHLEDPVHNHITDRDIQYLEKLKNAFAIMSEDYTIKGRVSRVMETCDITTRVQAKNILKDAAELFAPIFERNKEIELYFQLERLHGQLNTMKENTSIEDNYLKIEIEKLIAKLNLELKTKGGEIPAFPKVVVLSSNPDLLK